MRKTMRRGLGVVIGLALGWWAAGLLPGSLSAETVPATSQAKGSPPAQPGEAHHEEHGDAGLKATRELVPSREQVPWLRPVLLGVGGLFAAAILIGVPISRMKTAASAVKDGDDHATAKTDHGHSAAKAGH